MKLRRGAQLTLLALATASTVGCSLIPDLTRPTAPVPVSYPGDAATADRSAAQESP